MSEPVYPRLEDRHSPSRRPWTAVNMVATIDGKTLSGERDEHVMDLGSSVDHATMRALETAHDAVLIGAGSLRATPGLWYPKDLKRFVVSATGRLDYESRFFTDAPDQAWVVTTTAGGQGLPPDIQRLDCGREVRWEDVLWTMKRDLAVKTLLIEGGSMLNASLLAKDLVDELFLTVAPKVKLGRDTPTYADGEPLSRDQLLEFALVSCTTVADEVFLRYQRRR